MGLTRPILMAQTEETIETQPKGEEVVMLRPGRCNSCNHISYIDNALLLTFTCAIYFKSHKLRTFLSKFWFMRTILVLAADLLLLSYYIYHLVLHYEHVLLIHFLLCLVKTIFFTWHLKRQVSND